MNVEWILRLVVLSGVIAVLSGCEESVDPIIGSEKPFTVWGFMNAGADTQYARVFPVREELVPSREEGIDARVFSTNMMTGVRREWSYEVVQFDSLIEGHVFWAPFRAEHDHRYRLEVIRSDGATSHVEVTVPSEVNFQINVDQGSTRIPVRITGDVPNLIGLRVIYHAVNVPPKLAWPPDIYLAGAVQLPVAVSYDYLIRREQHQWAVDIDMVRDFGVVQEAFEFNCLVTEEGGSAPDIWLRQMEFRALAADSTWAPPGGVFDPNILSVPGTFTNVENGHGFFGAAQELRYTWTPDMEVALNSGFNFRVFCDFLFAREVPECMNPPMPCVGERQPDLWRIWLD